MNDYQNNELIKCRDSYKYFIDNYLKLNLKDYQHNFLYRVHNYRNNILLAPRRSGKDYTVLPYLLWCALFNHQKSISILGNRLLNSKRLLLQVASMTKFLSPSFYEALHGTRPIINDQQILFANGNSINIKFGYNAYRNEDTEILYISDYNNFYNDTYPAFNGETSKIIIASSLHLPTDEFYNKWKQSVKGVGTFIPTKWDIKDTFKFLCDDFDKFKQETIDNIGQKHWETEFECNFREDVKSEIQQKLPTKETVIKELDKLLLDYLHGRLS